MKPYTCLSCQLSIMKERGITLGNMTESDAKLFLLRKSYYNTINFYSRFFLIDGQINKFENCSLQNIQSVYAFDKNIRMLLFDKLMDCEANLKSTISQYFCDEYSDKEAYLDHNCLPSATTKTFNYFKNNVCIKAIDRAIIEGNNSITHHKGTYGFVPFWVMTNYLTLGNIKTFYEMLDQKLQSKISKSFRDNLQTSYNTSINIGPDEFHSYTLAIQELRNKIAHDNIIVNFSISESVKYNDFVHKEFSGNPHIHRTSLFDVLLVMKIFISSSNYRILINKLRREFYILSKSINPKAFNKVIDHMGFPSDWYKFDN